MKLGQYDIDLSYNISLNVCYIVRLSVCHAVCLTSDNYSRPNCLADWAQTDVRLFFCLIPSRLGAN